MRRHGRYGWIDADPAYQAQLAKEAASLRQDLTRPVEMTPLDLNSMPEDLGSEEPDFSSGYTIEPGCWKMTLDTFGEISEPEEKFLDRIDSTLDAFNELTARIEEDAGVCKGLGGDEDGGIIVGLEVTEEEWQLLSIHFAYYNGAYPHRPHTKTALHYDYASKYGMVRLYRKKTQ